MRGLAGAVLWETRDLGIKCHRKGELGIGLLAGRKECKCKTSEKDLLA